MNLAYVTALFPCGPREQFLAPEVELLCAQGHAVVVIPVRPADAGTAGPWKVARRPIVFAGAFAALVGALVRSPRRFLAAAAGIVRTGARNAARNVTILPKACWLALEMRRRSIDHIHAQWGTTPSSVAYVAARLAGVPWSFTVHRHDILVNNALTAKVHDAAFVRFPSRAAYDDTRARVGEIPESRTLHAHMGVAVPERPAPIRSDSRVVVCPAALTARKGQEVLLRALTDVDSVTVWFAGIGEDRDKLERLAADLGVTERTRFLGLVPHDELLALYGTGDVWAVVLPTEHEGIPFALMEAMAYGVPVVSTPVGGIPELLRDCAGVIVPRGDPGALASALLRLDRDDNAHRALRTAGRQRIIDEFELEATVRALEAAITRASAGRS